MLPDDTLHLNHSRRLTPFKKSASRKKLIDINKMQAEGMISIRGLLLKRERPEKNMPPQLVAVKS